MSRKRVFYIVFFSVLVLGFFFSLSYALPGFIDPPRKPISVVKPFSFINQDGDVVTEKAAAGKVSAVNFFFTTCRGICPQMTNNLLPVYEAFKNEPDFMLFSFTCDPARDSADRLKRFADSLKVDTRKWVFLTGRKDSLYNTARHSYQLDDPKNYVQRIEDDFLHTQYIALVNRKGEVMKIYDGIKASEMAQMKAEIKQLLEE
ncbi:MAG TPA: SCO family protein [Flavisolibacter sp.]|nr:SCO family protein [Flavisolibacter sp.]